MRQVVRDSFRDFTVKREGFTPFMYCDVLNLVTTGIGNLIDNGPHNSFDTSEGAMAPAMRLPWKFKAAGWNKNNPVAGATASQADIRAAWIATKLKEQSSPGFNKGGGFAYQNLTPLTLDHDGLNVLFERTLNSFDTTLAGRYPGYTNWPADAQLAILSMSWAMGPGFNFPQFKAAVDREDFSAAVPLAFFKGGGPLTDVNGIPFDPSKSRNAAHVIMFNNAANIVKGGGDRNRLFFPGTSDSSPSFSVSSLKPSLISALEALAITAGIAAVGFGTVEIMKNRGAPSRRRRAT